MGRRCWEKSGLKSKNKPFLLCIFNIPLWCNSVPILFKYCGPHCCHFLDGGMCPLQMTSLQESLRCAYSTGRPGHMGLIRPSVPICCSISLGRTPTGSTGGMPSIWREDKQMLAEAPLPRQSKPSYYWGRLEVNVLSIPMAKFLCSFWECNVSFTGTSYSILLSQSDFKKMPCNFRRQTDPTIQCPVEKTIIHRWPHWFISLMVISLFLHITQNKKHKIVLYWINWDIKEQIYLFFSDYISPSWPPSIAACCQRKKKED